MSSTVGYEFGIDKYKNTLDETKKQKTHKKMKKETMLNVLRRIEL